MAPPARKQCQTATQRSVGAAAPSPTAAPTACFSSGVIQGFYIPCLTPIKWMVSSPLSGTGRPAAWMSTVTIVHVWCGAQVLFDSLMEESVFEERRVIRVGRLRVLFNSSLRIRLWEMVVEGHCHMIPHRRVADQVLPPPWLHAGTALWPAHGPCCLTNQTIWVSS